MDNPQPPVIVIDTDNPQIPVNPQPEPPVIIDTEKLCLRCGRCCHRKEIVRGKVVFTKDTCPNLVKDERGKTSCSIYGDHLGSKLNINGHTVRCITSEDAFRIGALPADCPYVYYYGNVVAIPPTNGAAKEIGEFFDLSTGRRKRELGGHHP